MRKTYLVPLDGSSLGEAALPWARLLAGEDKSIELLRCLSASSKPDPLLESAQEYLDRVKEEHGLSGAQLGVKQGKAAETILAESQDERVEAVVMSSHGAGGLGKWLVGSVTSKVLRGSSAPVFVARAENSDCSPQLQKMVVCLDGSSLAERGLDWAVQLAERFGAHIKLVGVVNPQGQSPSALKAALDETSDYLSSQVARFPEIKMETSVRAAGILEGILKESSGYDLTIITSHGHGGFQRWLLGSLTEKILNRGQTTLLVVPVE